MKFKEYVDELNEYLENNPEIGDYEVVYAKDSEGNDFDKVYYGPSKGVYLDNEFVADCGESEETIKEWMEDLGSEEAVCIN